MANLSILLIRIDGGKMREERNICRYWQYKINRTIFRQWTDEEYNTINPHTHRFEKRWFVYYPNWTGRLPLPYNTKEEAENKAHLYEEQHNHLSHHKAHIVYEDCEFVCEEYKEVFVPEMNIWIPKKIVY